MSVTAVITAGGSGTRFSTSIKKQYAILAGKPVLFRAIDIFYNHPEVTSIVIVLPYDSQKGQTKEIKKNYPEKQIVITQGGSVRQDSVLNGLLSCPEGTSIVLIHDGVRPFVNPVEITRLISKVKECGAAILAQKVAYTLKKGEEGYISETISRDGLFLAHTPQGFLLDTILKAHLKARDEGQVFTDDAAVAEYYGQKVQLVECSADNIKITTPEDLARAEKLFFPKRSVTAIGQDSHKFSTDKNRKLVLAGVVIENEPGLEGNSDADVILHAVTNAISGITGINILGPLADSMCKEGIINSDAYVQEALKHLKGSYISHISLSIEAYKPKLNKYLPAFKKSLSTILGLTEQEIGITATSGEGLTEFGKGQGIQAFAVITVEK